jgi:hypothetical protein
MLRCRHRKRRPYPRPPLRRHRRCRHSNRTSRRSASPVLRVIRASQIEASHHDASYVLRLTPFRSQRTNRNRANQRGAIPNDSFARMVSGLTLPEARTQRSFVPHLVRASHIESSHHDASYVLRLTPFRSQRTNRNRANRRGTIPNNSFS